MSMLPATTVRMMVDGMSALLMLALIIGMARTSSERNTDSSKRGMLLLGMWLHLFCSLLDLLAAAFMGSSGPGAFLLTGMGLFLAHLLVIATSVVGTAYIYTDTTGRSLRDENTRRLVIVLLLINALNLSLVLSNPWTHVYYQHTQANRVALGDLTQVGALLVTLQTVMMLVGVWRLCRNLSFETSFRLLACGGFIALGVFIGLVYPGFSLLYPSICMVYVVLAVGVQAQLEKDLARARAETAESRVRLLSGQIHPHFVFNSLAAIKELLTEDPERAEMAVQDFSDYLRSHLDEMSTTRLVPFLTEIDHVRHYVSLEMADASVPLVVDYELAVDDFMVPPLTVQPLVENAIRHGLRTREGGGHVVVSSRCSGDNIVVSVVDDGHGFSSATERQEERHRIGIENVRERIERQCGGRLEVTSDETGTTASLIIPRGDRS